VTVRVIPDSFCNCVRINPYSAEPVLVRAPALATRLREKIRGHYVRDLARRSGVDKGTISAWTKEPEDGKAPTVRVDSVAKLARVLGVEVTWLLDLPTTSPSAEAALTADLRSRLSSLSHHAEELELPAQELDRALEERLGHASRLSLLLAELRELDAEARGLETDPQPPAEDNS
jgi:transcriptional regulator with XRE-family HTH domain